MREQIKGIFDFSKVEEIVESYVDNNEEDIKDLMRESISKRLKG